MIETDRRSLIVGAIATLFAGVTLPEALAAARPVVPVSMDFNKLWWQIYTEMRNAFKMHFGRYPVELWPEHEFILTFTDSIYENIKATEALLDSFQINVASADTLSDWEKTQRMSPSVTIKGFLE